MKAAPAGWLSPGNVAAAAHDAATRATPAPCTQIAISGAAAVASAVTVADAGNHTVHDIIAAGIEGAERGERIGIGIGREAGPSVAVDGLWNTKGRVVDLFTPEECRNCFKAAGYDATRSGSALAGVGARDLLDLRAHAL